MQVMAKCVSKSLFLNFLNRKRKRVTEKFGENLCQIYVASKFLLSFSLSFPFDVSVKVHLSEIFGAF